MQDQGLHRLQHLVGQRPHTVMSRIKAELIPAEADVSARLLFEPSISYTLVRDRTISFQSLGVLVQLQAQWPPVTVPTTHLHCATQESSELTAVVIQSARNGHITSVLNALPAIASIKIKHTRTIAQINKTKKPGQFTIGEQAPQGGGKIEIE